MANTRKKTPKRNDTGTIESDNHADTWCFGPNFVIDHFTGQTCSGSGYNGTVNDEGIAIGTGLTLWTDPETSQKHLLQVNQGLDMRHILDHTLANPNQCRSFGISWCDDAWDPHRLFDIDCKGPDLLIPSHLQGSTALFTTRTPTEDKIRSLYDDQIELTDDATWDPGRLPGIVTVNVTSDASAVLRMKNDVPSEGLRVCATMERDAGYIEDAGD